MSWFEQDGIWIIVTVLVAVLLLLVWRYWALMWISAFTNKFRPDEEDRSAGTSLIRRIVFWVGGILIIGTATLLILWFAGADIGTVTDDLENAGDTVWEWLKNSGVHIAIIITVAIALQQAIRSLIPPLVHSQTVRKEKKRRIIEEAEQRAVTLSGFVVSVGVVLIWVIAFFLALPELNIDIGPLLAGAGIIGIAIGFGAQGLIRDIITGLFVIIEDQYARGDWVQLGSVDGEVVYLGVRRTVLRDFDGTHHNIPNGEIKIASNYSKDWACVNMDISVSYGKDLDYVTEVINQVCEEIALEAKWQQVVIQVPHVLRVQKFGDSGIDMKVWGTTKPMMQWTAMGEIRRRLKIRFDEEGIEIPWPHMKLYFGRAAGEKSKVTSNS